MWAVLLENQVAGCMCAVMEGVRAGGAEGVVISYNMEEDWFPREKLGRLRIHV